MRSALANGILTSGETLQQPHCVEISTLKTPTPWRDTKKQKCFFPSVETANRRRLGAVKVRLVSKQLSDVGDAVLDHGGPLEAQPPSDHAHILNGGKEHHEKKNKNKGNGRRSLVICTGLELL